MTVGVEHLPYITQECTEAMDSTLAMVAIRVSCIMVISRKWEPEFTGEPRLQVIQGMARKWDMARNRDSALDTDRVLAMDLDIVLNPLKMRAMNIKFNMRRDDYDDRLFAYLETILAAPVVACRIKEGVYYVKSGGLPIVLKHIPSVEKWSEQKTFTNAIRKEGFNSRYVFNKVIDKPIIFRERVYACLEYIQPGGSPFVFGTQRERAEGLSLLTHFHDITGRVARWFQPEAGSYDLKGRWKARYAEFTSHLQWINGYLPPAVTDEILDWAQAAIDGLDTCSNLLVAGAPVILHGDVASHNFLRGTKGRLFLIDFDLISIGPPICDLLQYANRILPFTDWGLDSLSALKEMNPFLENQAFLYGLLYPSDLLREWNRMAREKAIQKRKLAVLLQWTFSQMVQRRSFILEIKKLAGA